MKESISKQGFHLDNGPLRAAKGEWGGGGYFSLLYSLFYKNSPAKAPFENTVVKYHYSSLLFRTFVAPVFLSHLVSCLQVFALWNDFPQLP